MKYFSFLLVFLTLACLQLCFAESSESDIRHVTNCSPGHTRCLNLESQRVEHICSGKISSQVKGELESFGISDTGWAKGVPCLAGDFDGNGVMDYAIFKNTRTQTDEDAPAFPTYDVLVLFFKDKTHFEFSGKLEDFNAREFSTERRDMIFKNTGADSNYLYLFDRKNHEWHVFGEHGIP